MAVGKHERSNEGFTNTWITPKYIIDALCKFDLDPCVAINQPWETAEHSYNEIDDGLSKPWFGRVWLNPPYGPHTGKWMSKLAEHGNGIALIFARTETKQFVENVWNKAYGVLFIHGRLCFYDEHGNRGKGNAGAPSCLVAYGYDCLDILERQKEIPGTFIRLLGDLQKAE